MRLIYRAADAAGPDLIGARAFTVSALGKRFSVPAWFVVSREAFQSCLNQEQRAKLQAARSIADIQVVLATVKPHPVLKTEISKEVSRFEDPPRWLALRPSFSDGELEANVPKGGLAGDLFVPIERAVERLLHIWQTFYGEANLRYRMERRMPALALPPPILVQAMLECECAGDAFDVEPGTGDRRVALVRAVPGCGTSLALGDCEPDCFFVGRDGSIEKAVIGQKVAAHAFDDAKGHGMKVIALPSQERNRTCISDERAAAVASLCREVGRASERPQAIQWAIAGGRLHLTGSKPLEGLGKRSDPEGRPCAWDLEGIAREIDGPCSPLTFSFHRRIESAGMCYAASLLSSKPASSSDARPIGFLAGRIYRNRTAWRAVLARSALPEEIKSLLHDGLFLGKPGGSRSGWKERGLDLVWEALACSKLAFEIRSCALRLPAALDRLREKLDGIAESGAARDISTDALLERWEAIGEALGLLAADGAANDLAISLLAAHLEKLSPDCGALDETDMALEEEELEEVDVLLDLTRHSLARDLEPLLRSGTLEEIEAGISAHGESRKIFSEALSRLAEGGFAALQLEIRGLEEDRLPLYRAIGSLCERASSGVLDLAPSGGKSKRTPQAPQGWRGKLFASEWKMLEKRVPLVLRWRKLRRRATRAAGAAFREIGRRLAAFEVLERGEDVFMLTIDEISDFMRGQSPSTGLRAIVAARRRELEEELSRDEPAAGQKTIGSPYQGAPLVREPAAKEALRFEPLAPGTAMAPLLFVRWAGDVPAQGGGILSLQRLGPGWSVTAAGSAGVVVRSGSIFAKRVCRRLGVPALKSLSDPRAAFRQGDLIELDGKLGTLRPVENPQETGKEDGENREQVKGSREAAPAHLSPGAE